MSAFTRRQMLGAIVAAGAPGVVFAQPTQRSGGASPKAPRFGFEEVVDRARELAAAPFEDPPARLPETFDKLDYDNWRDIRFRTDRAPSRRAGGPFRLETFHLGFLYRRPVTINMIRDGLASPIPYSPALFDYGRVKPSKPPPVNLGFAGFRLHYPLNDPACDTTRSISFLGASYFRFLGREQQYGLSARGLCVEAGTDKESFPFFREFWIETPPASLARDDLCAARRRGRDRRLPFRSDAGARERRSTCAATLFPRRANVKFGMAPLTSMFLTGENDHRIQDDFRAELHDSDGLLIQTGAGEWMWRPLSNPRSARTTVLHRQGQ